MERDPKKYLFQPITTEKTENPVVSSIQTGTWFESIRASLPENNEIDVFKSQRIETVSDILAKIELWANIPTYIIDNGLGENLKANHRTHFIQKACSFDYFVIALLLVLKWDYESEPFNLTELIKATKGSLTDSKMKSQRKSTLTKLGYMASLELVEMDEYENGKGYKIKPTRYLLDFFDNVRVYSDV